jgi:ribosomal 50S subunit-associated protein YjgA (DUF615 family)
LYHTACHKANKQSESEGGPSLRRTSVDFISKTMVIDTPEAVEKALSKLDATDRGE